MKKLFWEDPYKNRLQTKVESVEGSSITLEQTIFYAFSGGQESDAGTINGKQVLAAEARGDTIVYTLEEDHGLSPTDPVSVCIDWERRYDLMRLHFAAEIVLFLIMERFPGIQRIGAHISREKARLDFLHPHSFKEIIPEIQKRANTLIIENKQVYSYFTDMPSQQRCWEVPGFGSLPCGGTHIRSTGEIGAVTLFRRNPGKGKERIEIVLTC